MVVVPAGSFMMGSPADERERSETEGPQHRVAIPKPFAVGMFAVTFAEWDACAADGGCRGYKPNDQGWGRGNRPVINISWDDAKAFVAWLSKETGQPGQAASAIIGSFVAATGPTFHINSARRTATGSTQPSVTVISSSASGLPGR
jgi:formylglycine-generating enzyme required for sulfatase activity